MKHTSVLIVGLILLSMVALGQTAQIGGTVQDASGAAVPGATVKATQTETGVTRTATSAADGTYVLSNIPVGPYRLEVTRDGFASFVQTGIVLQVASSPTVDIQLKVGAVSEQVQVEANAALVETAKTNIGQVIENQRILELPLNGRNAIELVNLTPGVIQAGTSSSGNIPTGANFSIAGSQTFATQFYLDGTLYGGGTNSPFPFPDALQEFKVETASLSAANGVRSGAAINAVTKSGTNNFHGDAFEFFRNGKLNARNFFAAQRDTLKRNTYGGVVGGPIRKNKLFFFGGYQANKLRSDPGATQAFVPTQRMLQGDFTGCPGLTLRAPFTNGRVNPNLFSSAALTIAKQLPAALDECGRTLYGAIQKADDQQILGKVDWQVSDKQNMFFRYMALPFKQPPPYSLSGNLLATSVAGLDNLFQSYMIGDTYVISPSTVNSFRLAAIRTGNHRFNPDFFSGCDLGVKMTCFLPHQSVFNVTSAFSISGGTVSENSPTNTQYQVSDDISMVRGAHQFAYGVLAYYDDNHNRANVFSPGTFGFTGNVTGTPMADFLLGNLSTFTQGTPNSGFTNRFYLGLYIADTWKLTSRLTANIGIRWEPNFQTRVSNGAVYDFLFDKYLAGERSQVYTKAPPGVFWPGDKYVPNLGAINPRYNQFAPRIGLAWDPRGDGKMSIRAGFGYSYDVTGGSLANVNTAPPFGNTVTVNSAVPFTNPWINTPGGDPHAASCGGNPCGKDAAFPPDATYIAVEPDMKTTAVSMWNLSIQRQIAQSWIVTGTYIGSATSHLWMVKQRNPGTILPGVPTKQTCTAAETTSATANCINNLALRRLFTRLRPADPRLVGFMDQMDAGGSANYNGLLLSVQKRFGQGFAVSANYTWSHCIGDLTQGSGVNGGGSGYQDLNNRRFDRANCGSQQIAGNFGTDRRHIYNMTMVVDSPKFSNRALRMAFTGWRMSPIFRVYSGGFVSLMSGLDLALSGTANQRPDQINADPYCAVQTTKCYLNPQAFRQPAPGKLGNMGKFNVKTPGQWGLDATLSRSFSVYEGVRLETRLEAFNLTNSYFPGVPSGVGVGMSGIQTNLNSSNFGQVTGALDPRILQLAMKVVF